MNLIRITWHCAAIYLAAAASRAEIRFVGVLEIGPVAYYAVADKGAVQFIKLGERFDDWQLVAYDKRGALSLRKEHELKVLWLPRSRIQDADPFVRAHTLAAKGDKEVAYMISWLRDLAAMKHEALRKLNDTNPDDIARIDAHLRKLTEWEAMAKERTIILTLASEAQP